MIIDIIIHDMKMTTIFLAPRKLEQSNYKALSLVCQ